MLSYIFPFLSFRVVCLILRSLVYFKLVSEQGNTQGSSFILIHTNTQSPQHHLLKRSPFLQSMILTSCLRISWLKMCWLISSAFPVVCESVFYPMTCWFCYYDSVRFEIRYDDAYSIDAFVRDCSGYLKPSVVLCIFLDAFFIVLGRIFQKFWWVVYWICRLL